MIYHIINIESLNQKLADYDHKVIAELEPVLDEIRVKSKALASNLKECFDRLQGSDRYLRAANGEKVAIKESEFTGEEFDIFRKYVRLLRSCTIMCGNDCSLKFKKIFIDFFSGTRLQLAKAIYAEDPQKTQEKQTS